MKTPMKPVEQTTANCGNANCTCVICNCGPICPSSECGCGCAAQ